MTHQQARWIPKDSREIAHPEGLGVAYAYEFDNIRKARTFAVCAYTSRAKKATFHESYLREESRDKRIAEFFANMTAHEKLKAEYRAERSKAHTLQPGDIIHHSWGWEQTQCDYYQIVSVTAHSAVIRPIQSHVVEGSTYSHGMADMRTAVKDAFAGDPIKVRINGYNHIAASDGVFSYGSANKWDGKPNYCSWYA